MALRLWLLTQGFPAPNTDEATAGLAAWHIAQGSAFPVFFYGQSYLGAIYSYVAAPFFVLFEPSVFVLRLPALMLYAGFLVVMYHLVKRLCSPWFAVFTVGLLSLGADRVLRNQLIGGGQYPESLFCVALLFLLTLYGGTRRALHFGAWGLLAGLMLWNSWNTLPCLAVAGLLLLVRCRSYGWRFAVLGVGVVVGALPLLWHNVVALPEDRSLHVLQILTSAGTDAPLTDRFHGGAVLGLPLALGLCEPGVCHPWQLTLVPTVLTAALLTVLTALLLALSRSALSRFPLRPARADASRSALSRSALSRSALSRSALSRFPLRPARADASRSALSRFPLRPARADASRSRGRLVVIHIHNADPHPLGRDQTARGSRLRGCGSHQRMWITMESYAVAVRRIATGTKAVIARYRSGLTRSCSGGDGWVRGGLVAAGVVTTVLYVRSPASADTPIESARYLHLLLVSWPFVLWPLWQRRVAGRAVLAGLAAGMCWATIHITPVDRAKTQAQQRVLAVLEERGITEYYGDYWACGWGSLSTSEKRVCGVLNDELRKGFNRYEPHWQRVANANPKVFVASADSSFDRAVRAKLTGYEVIELGAYRVYDGRYGRGREGLDSS